jgi:hypothetical protein
VVELWPRRERRSCIAIGRAGPDDLEGCRGRRGFQMARWGRLTVVIIFGGGRSPKSEPQPRQPGDFAYATALCNTSGRALREHPPHVWG